MIVGSAAHLAIENKVKHGDDLIVTADAYIQENLLDKFDAKLLDPKAFNEKREAMLECLRNWEQQFYPWMMENIQDPDKQVEVKLQTEFRGTLFTGVVDVVLDSGVFADWKTGKVPTMDTLAKDAQSIVYYWLAKQNGLPPPPKFIYVYLIGQPTNYKMEEYKSGPRKGELHPVLDKDNPKNKYSFPVEVTDDKVDSLLNNYLGPLTEAYKRRIYYKNPSDYNCKSCIYRTACKDTDLPSREDYDLPRVLT